MTARIYVGTYAKYNSGSIKGAWIDLEDHSDKQSLLAACAELHKDKFDPELMFQDYEGLPRALYSESSVSDGLWDWLALDEHDRELLAVYQEHVDEFGTFERARDAYYGQYDSVVDWAAEYLNECGNVPEHLQGYIDYAAYARDSEMIFARHGGSVWAFSRY